MPEAEEGGRTERSGRESAIVKASAVGIALNVVLAAFKAAVGIMSNSIAVTLDSVNNLSDAGSSVITIIGTKLASKPADKKHPFGHGRIEYLSAMVIGLVILYAGITFLVESVKKIASPTPPEYGWTSIVILAAAVIVKIAMGVYVKKTGERVNSESLVASGKDALMDAVVSAATIAAAFLYIKAGVAVEAYLGAVISLLILKAGYETLREAISAILGERVEADTARSIKKTISEIEGVRGVYDLTLTDYGPDNYIASAHIEVDDDTTIAEVDKLQWKISKAVMERHGIIMSAVGVYPSNTGDGPAGGIKKKIAEHLSKYPEVLELHGLYVDRDEATLRMDIVIDFDAKDRLALFAKIKGEITDMFREYKVIVNLDLDICAL
nr:cation transporter [Treponema sp.]